MSAVGHSRRFWPDRALSAVSSTATAIADIRQASYGLKSKIRSVSIYRLPWRLNKGRQ